MDTIIQSYAEGGSQRGVAQVTYRTYSDISGKQVSLDAQNNPIDVQKKNRGFNFILSLPLSSRDAVTLNPH